MGRERVVRLLFVVVAVYLVAPELDVSDFRGNGVDGYERPAGEVAHRLSRIDMLGARGLVDGRGIIPEGFGLGINIRDLGFFGAAPVSENNATVAGTSVVAIDWEGVFVIWLRASSEDALVERDGIVATLYYDM